MSSARATISSGETRTPANSGSSRSRATASIVAPTSTCRNSVTCGAVNALAATAAAVCLRTPRIGMRSSRPAARAQLRYRGQRLAARGPLHVVPGDRAGRPGAGQPGQVHAEVPGQLAHRRFGQHRCGPALPFAAAALLGPHRPGTQRLNARPRPVTCAPAGSLRWP